LISLHPISHPKTAPDIGLTTIWNLATRSAACSGGHCRIGSGD
jgi:hypothetical protein